MTGQHGDGIHIGRDAGQLALVRNLIDASAQETARRMREEMRAENAQMLLAVGFDVTNPLEAQATMAAMRKLAALQDDPEEVADARYVRGRRKWSEGGMGYAFKAVVTVIATGGIYAFINGALGMVGVSLPHK